MENETETIILEPVKEEAKPKPKIMGVKDLPTKDELMANGEKYFQLSKELYDKLKASVDAKEVLTDHDLKEVEFKSNNRYQNNKALLSNDSTYLKIMNGKKERYGSTDNDVREGIEKLSGLKKEKNSMIMKAIGQMVKGVFVAGELSARNGQIYRYRMHSPIGSRELKTDLERIKKMNDNREEKDKLQVNIDLGGTELFKWLFSKFEDIDETRDYYDDSDTLDQIRFPEEYCLSVDNDTYEIINGNKIPKSFGHMMNIYRPIGFNLSYNKTLEIELINGNVEDDDIVYHLMVLKHKDEIWKMFENYESTIEKERERVKIDIEEIKNKAASLLVVACL